MKRLFFSIMLIFLIIAASDALQAKVDGRCSNCHTMHNSQGRSEMATYGGTSGANPCLTQGDCIGCHAYDRTGTNNVIIIGDGDQKSRIPQVFHNADTDLAAGNFKYLADADDRGHNVAAINNLENNGNIFPPPGDQHGTGITQPGVLTCAGVYGCHGDRSKTNQIDAIKGAHHKNDGILKFGSIEESAQAPAAGSAGDKIGLSYRFLMGVKGGEEANWMGQSPGALVHNEYKGVDGPGGSSLTSPASNTISGFCAECHGYYHGNGTDETGGSTSPWIRHPVDIQLYNNYPNTEYQDYDTYNIDVPVARTTIPDTPSNAVDDSDIIMCLSCHRAHAGPYYKLIRWDNKASMSGCVVCHTSKS